MTPQTNPERDQDRVFDTVDTFNKYGYTVFPQQRRIYALLADRLRGRNVLEAGCGNGCGTAVLERACGHVVGTDKLDANVRFARELYPWIRFETWDLNRPAPPGLRGQAVVAVECFEHVADPWAAMRHLLAAATEEVWISTPDGRLTEKDAAGRPTNPYHVREYTPDEMMEFLFAGAPAGVGAEMRVLGWEDLGPVDPDAAGVTPLVYHIVLER